MESDVGGHDNVGLPTETSMTHWLVRSMIKFLTVAHARNPHVGGLRFGWESRTGWLLASRACDPRSRVTVHTLDRGGAGDETDNRCTFPRTDRRRK
jgi:hypothetical protein